VSRSSALPDHAMIDRAWRGYDPRAMVPWLILAGVLSVGLLIGRWYLDELSWVADRAGALAVYAMVLAVWPGLLMVLLYRAIAYTYRLTDKAILIDRGSRSLPEPPLDLAELTEVTATTGWLCVGTVVLATRDRQVRLTGVRDPQRFADEIRAVAATLKSGASCQG
jgi:hypothetical protein